MTALSVNLNKIALLRNSRGRNFPDIESFAERALKAGAKGITLHPRPDQRHARYTDLYSIKTIVDAFNAELNVEGYPTEDFIEIVEDVKPHQCTLVPDKPNQITSDHGWDMDAESEFLEPIIKRLKNNSIRVSLFTDPNNHTITLCKKAGADRVELYTEQYAHHYHTKNREHITESYTHASRHAHSIDLQVNAGHDLSLENIGYLCSHCNIQEVSIGHALIVESFDYGFDETIRRYVEILHSSFPHNKE